MDNRKIGSLVQDIVAALMHIDEDGLVRWCITVRNTRGRRTISVVDLNMKLNGDGCRYVFGYDNYVSSPSHAVAVNRIRLAVFDCVRSLKAARTCCERGCKMCGDD